VSHDAPYSGLRVLDASQGVAGPHCGMLLAQYGADVIKVEPTGGDWARRLGAVHGEHSALSMAYNLGKRSVALDLKQPAAVAVLHRLARDADVFLESSRPGVAERLGIGYESLRVVAPRLVYVSVSGFGQQGPYRDRPCSDTVAQAWSGFMSVNRGEDGVPHKVDTIIMDAVTGLYAFGAVAAALTARGASGQGRFLDIGLGHCAVAIQAAKVIEGTLEPGGPLRLNSPAGTYRTADGWIAITLTREEHFGKLCTALGIPGLAADPRFASFATRAAHHDELHAQIAERVRARTTDAWRETLHAHDVLAERILSHADWLADPHVRETGLAPEVTVAGVGAVPMALTPGVSRHHGEAPGIGRDGADILRAAGLDEEEIAALTASGALGAGREVVEPPR
jgi:crotonobetainyl-CoA:carnitine CoA-transferase CaiB-like acyl-CoA transferase